MKKIKQAVDICFQYGQIDGAHHKMWVIDQVLRILLDKKYKEEVKRHNENDYYEWDCGIAP